MVGVGIGGGAVATLLRAPADVVLGLVTIGGVGYTVNKTNQASVPSEIIAAGKRNLICIEQTARQLDAKAGAARPSLLKLRPSLEATIFKLKFDLAESRKAPPVSDLPVWQARADTALPPASKLLQQLDEYLMTSDVGVQVYYAVDKTVSEVNTQLRRQALDVDAIARSGSIFQTFVTANSGVSTQAKAASAAVGSGTASGQSATAVDARITLLMQDLNVLAGIVKAITDALPTTQSGEVTKISDCVTQLPGESDIVVEPKGPISLEAGGKAVNLRIAAYGTWTTEWIGAVPSAAQLVKSSPSSSVVSLFAPAGAPADSYTFYVQQSAPSKRSDLVVVQVVQPAIAKKPEQTAKLQGTSSNTDSTVMKEFLDWRLRLGLDGNVKTKTDPKWATRVRVLESCLKLPVTGETSEALKKSLAASVPVNLNGDCPTPLASGSTPANPPVGAASSSSSTSGGVPVPPTPKL